MVDPQFWKNKKVFVTGHTGFKGSWLTLWLQKMGAQLCGYALEAPTEPSLFKMAQIDAEHHENKIISIIGDINNYELLSQSMKAFNPEIVIHMAAQPLVRYSYSHPLETYRTNVLGTAHVLEAGLQCSQLKAVVNVTTDKCYENKEWHWGYRESDPMGGYDPYSSSKGCSELVTASYRQSFYNKKKVSLSSARAGNVIGGGDFALDRLVPDLIRSHLDGKTLIIRNPLAIRPWQHVLEPLCGYLQLAQTMYENPQKFCEAYNFGPLDSEVENVQHIVNQILEKWTPNKSFKVEGDALHEAHYLKLDCSKAKAELHWTPQLKLDETLNLLVDWYKAVMVNRESARAMTLNQISFYQNKLSQMKV